MSTATLELSLIASAEAMHRKSSPAILKIQRESYEFCISVGLSDEEIMETMAVTSHQLRQIKKFKN